ncbi:Acyl-CoA-binding domain-containing protein 6 [Bienertia sinuspersici]
MSKKVHLSDPSQGTKSPLRPLKRAGNSNGERIIVAADHGNEPDCQCSSAPQDINHCTSGSSESWMVLSIAGDKPKPRFNHAAAVVGNKMVVVGGECTDGMLDDVQVLSFDQFSWTSASSKIYLSPNSLPLKIPSCKGHSLFLEQRRPPETACTAENSGRYIMGDIPSFSESGNLNVPNSVCEKFPLDNEEIFFAESDEKAGGFSAPSSIYQLYETRMAALIRKTGMLEGQLAAAVASREAAEKNASSVLKDKQDTEKKLADTVKELDLLKEKLGGLELVQEESNNLSNIVHSDNVRLEHDVAFLKAVLDDTQKELHSTRGMLANERARAFQLQVEVFHLKQRLQSLENRAPSQRKPYQV